jgi:hypothetical protein
MLNYINFRDYVTQGEITINPIDTKDQLADYLNKTGTTCIF